MKVYQGTKGNVLGEFTTADKVMEAIVSDMALRYRSPAAVRFEPNGFEFTAKAGSIVVTYRVIPGGVS